MSQKAQHDVESLVFEASSTQVRLSNVQTQVSLLMNAQFIENVSVRLFRLSFLLPLFLRGGVRVQSLQRGRKRYPRPCRFQLAGMVSMVRQNTITRILLFPDESDSSSLLNSLQLITVPRSLFRCSVSMTRTTPHHLLPLLLRQPTHWTHLLLL